MSRTEEEVLTNKAIAGKLEQCLNEVDIETLRQHRLAETNPDAFAKEVAGKVLFIRWDGDNHIAGYRSSLLFGSVDRDMKNFIDRQGNARRADCGKNLDR